MEVLKVSVSTKWLVQMMQGRLGSASGAVGKMDGMSSDRSDYIYGPVHIMSSKLTEKPLLPFRPN